MVKMAPENLDLGFTIKPGNMSQAVSLVLPLASGRRSGLSTRKLNLQILVPTEMSMLSQPISGCKVSKSFQC